MPRRDGRRKRTWDCEPTTPHFPRLDVPFPRLPRVLTWSAGAGTWCELTGSAKSQTGVAAGRRLGVEHFLCRILTATGTPRRGRNPAILRGHDPGGANLSWAARTPPGPARE